MWAAVLAGTVVVVFVFTALVTAIVAADEGDDGAARLAGTIAVALTPVALLAMAFVSRRRRWVVWSVVAGGLAVALFVGLAASITVQAATVAAFGAGGAISLRADGDRHSMAWRLGAVVIVTAYVMVLARVSAGLSLLITPFLPLPALMVADSITEKRSVVSDQRIDR